tara:strand:+ start:523 stop:1191 length:669 start_codon:yes stop_codon:yes gene_type:complete
MFQIIVQIILFIYSIFVVYHIINLQKFNINGFIIDTGSTEEVQKNTLKLNPVILYTHSLFNLNDPRLNYLQDINNYKNNYPSFVYKNNELFERIVEPSFIFDSNIFHESHFHFPIKKTLSIVQGENSIPLKKCIHNHNIIGVLEGESIIYLFNPKHKDEIINKENHQIKKWGHKKHIKKGDVLFIPPYWSYIQEVEKGIIQYHIDIDTYFTFIPNFLKEIYS